VRGVLMPSTAFPVLISTDSGSFGRVLYCTAQRPPYITGEKAKRRVDGSNRTTRRFAASRASIADTRPRNVTISPQFPECDQGPARSYFCRVGGVTPPSPARSQTSPKRASKTAARMPLERLSFDEGPLAGVMRRARSRRPIRTPKRKMDAPAEARTEGR
jgi:hypothetical protein